MNSGKLIICVLLLSIFSSYIHAQCESCSEEETTFCYQNEKFQQYCAVFKDGEDTFELVKGKKTRIISLTTNADLDEMIAITQDKKLKITATELLFLQQALKVWEVERRKIGFDFTASGLGIKIIEQGNGAVPTPGQNIRVHYSGFLETGEKFDSSVDRNEPFVFPLGEGRVIKGWDEGFSALNVGTKAVLMIPPSLAYGSRGAGGVIPPDATLFFEVELLGIE